MDEAMMTMLDTKPTTTSGMTATMDHGDGGEGALHMLHRRGASALGLGWLIAITLCGGVSLFLCVGFMLAWRAHKRHRPLTITRTTLSLPYAASGLTTMLRSAQPSTTRLTKRHRMGVLTEHGEANASSPRKKTRRGRGGWGASSDDEGDEKMPVVGSMAWSRELSHRFSFKAIPSAPVLPPLPSYSTFRLFNPRRLSYRRERGWLDEESLEASAGGGMQMVMSRPDPARQRAGSGSGWAGQMGTPPTLQQRQQQYSPQKHQHHQQPQSQEALPPRPPPHQQDPRLIHHTTNEPHDRHNTTADYDHDQQLDDEGHGYGSEEHTAMHDAAYAGDYTSQGSPARPPAAVLATRPSRTDSELRDILRSTEQRLRDGRSRSPQKGMATPQGSPSKQSVGTPTHTPLSGGGSGRRVVSKVGMTHHYLPATHSNSGSPTRHAGGGVPNSHSAGRGGLQARDGSAMSVNSAANSLIREATQQLELPGGMNSPSRLRGHEWLDGDDAILQLTARHEHEDPDDHPLQRDIANRQYQLYLLEQEEKQQQQQQQKQQQQQQQQRSRQRSPQRERSERRRSNDSDASSSLSTLYSVGDDMDRASIMAVVEGDRVDPFVEDDGATMPLYNQVARKQSKLLFRAPQWLGEHAHKSLDAFAGRLHPGQGRGDEEVRPKTVHTGFSIASPYDSESSFTDISVDSTMLSSASLDSSLAGMEVDEETDTITAVDDEEDEEDEDDLSSESGGNTIEIPGFSILSTPVKERKRAASDASSSPFSEHDIVNMIIAAQTASPSKNKKKRPLPNPPSMPTVVSPDGCTVSTVLYPPPKSLARTATVRAAAAAAAADTTPVPPRKVSGTSSYYDDDGCDTALPSRKNSTIKPYNPTTTTLRGVPASRSAQGVVINGLSVCNSVAELRRMNSVISLASDKSLTSMGAVDQGEAAPTLPYLADGRLPQLQSARKAPRMGSKQYLNVTSSASTSSMNSSNASTRKRVSPRKRNSTAGNKGHGRSNAAFPATAETPERPAKNPRRSLGTVSTLVDRYTEELQREQEQSMQKELDRQQQQLQAQQQLEKEQDYGKENAGMGISRPPSRNEGTQALQESRVRSRGGTPTRGSPREHPQQQQQRHHVTSQAAPKMAALKNPLIAELAAAERRKNDKHGSVDSLGLYDKDGFLLPSPERELQKKLLRM